MKKLFLPILTALSAMLFLSLPSQSQAATPADQNFDATAAGTLSPTGGTLTIAGIVYSTNSTNDQLAVNTIAQITGNLPSLGTGNALASNWLGTNTGTYFQFASSNNADNFRLVSFNAEVFGHSSFCSEIYILKGYDNGTEVASATVDFRVSGTKGTGTSTLSYTRLTTAQETTDSNDGANAGTLTFTGSAWGSVDQVRAIVDDGAPNTILAFNIDNIDFTDPTGGVVAPTVATPTSTAVTADSATLGGTLSATGGANATARGVVYARTSQNANPEIGGANVTVLTESGSFSTGAFTRSATALIASTGYSFKAYATNSAGTSYSGVGTFTTSAAPLPTATVTSLARANATPTNLTTVNWTLTFSSAVTGVTASHFTLGGTSTGASVGTPTTANAGLTWTVPVTTGTDGTLLLRLDNDTGLSSDVTTTLPFVGETYTVDKTAPDTSITATPALLTTSTSANFSYTGSDTGSGVASYQVKLDAASFATGTSPTAYTSLVDGSHTFQVRAVDVAGNVDASPASYTWVVDTTPPQVLSVTRLSPTGQAVSATTVTFRVTYSEAVTLNAPAAARYAVVPVGGSSSTGTVTGVTGTGATRDVTVSITGGTGEFRLRVVD